jgi:hypothetical protein
MIANVTPKIGSESTRNTVRSSVFGGSGSVRGASNGIPPSVDLVLTDRGGHNVAPGADQGVRPA